MCGCLARVLIPKHKKKKLRPTPIDTIFMGYIENTIAMSFLIIKCDIDGIMQNTIVEFDDATFPEKVFPLKAKIPHNIFNDHTHTSSFIIIRHKKFDEMVLALDFVVSESDKYEYCIVQVYR